MLVDEEIYRGRVEEALPGGLRTVGVWMDHEFRDASASDLRLLDRVGAHQRPQWTTTEILGAGVLGTYIGRIERLGALRKVARGRYLLVKPPMIARYHLWKRGLVGTSRVARLEPPPNP